MISHAGRFQRDEKQAAEVISLTHDGLEQLSPGPSRDSFPLELPQEHLDIA